uniref:Uncharacterized protein n=1 Tax=uncultured bacterium BLR8 TaxID=506524 RepID=C0IN80_9BACT|nr:hypothetical protein AKSOIL_0121 [uncultured bacterium BLR8]
MNVEKKPWFGATQDDGDKPRRRAGFDARGQPTLEVEVEKDVFKRTQADTERLRKLGVGTGGANELSLADTARVKKGSFNPYEGSAVGKPRTPPKPSGLDAMRKLSEEIKRRKALGLDPVLPSKSDPPKK